VNALSLEQLQTAVRRAAAIRLILSSSKFAMLLK